MHFTLILSTSGRLMKQIFYLLSFPFSDFLAASVCYKLSEISLAHLLGQESAKSNLRRILVHCLFLHGSGLRMDFIFLNGREKEKE